MAASLCGPFDNIDFDNHLHYKSLTYLHGTDGPPSNEQFAELMLTKLLAEHVKNIDVTLSENVKQSSCTPIAKNYWRS